MLGAKGQRVEWYRGSKRACRIERDQPQTQALAFTGPLCYNGQRRRRLARTSRGCDLAGRICRAAATATAAVSFLLGTISWPLWSFIEHVADPVVGRLDRDCERVCHES